MDYALFGRTGLAVSRLSFGAMTFGQGPLVPGVVNTINQDQADAMVTLALERGVTLFDTADMYTGGQSEECLGRSLRGRRQEVLVATKCGFRSGPALNARGGSYRYVVQAAETSLNRLGGDAIDFFFLHIPDPFTPDEESARALEDLTRRGVIRYGGVSNFSAWRAQKLLGLQERHGWSRLQAAQMYYSLLGRDLEAEFVPFLRDAGLGLMVWSPLASGYLTGKYTDAVGTLAPTPTPTAAPKAAGTGDDATQAPDVLDNGSDNHSGTGPDKGLGTGPDKGRGTGQDNGPDVIADRTEMAADPGGAGRRRGFDFPPINRAMGDQVVAALREIADGRPGTTPAEVALAWLLTRDFVTTILIGATSLDQLATNLRAAELRLSEDEIARLDTLTRPPLPYPAWMQPMGSDATLAAALGVRAPLS